MGLFIPAAAIAKSFTNLWQMVYQHLVCVYSFGLRSTVITYDDSGVSLGERVSGIVGGCGGRIPVGNSHRTYIRSQNCCSLC